MKKRFYIWALGSERNIRLLEQHMAIPGTTVSRVKAVSPGSQSKLDVVWKWRTPYQEVLSEFPEDDLEKFLDKNVSLVHQLKTIGPSLDRLGCMIVCDLAEGEILHGFSLSKKLISILASMGASLEIDINESPISRK